MPTTRWRWDSQPRSSRYGGELGDYATCKVDGIINSDKAIPALEPTRSFTSFTPPNWANAIFTENNQAITENLAAMSMNFFAFFPPLINESSNPQRQDTGFFANPAGPTATDSPLLAARASRSSPIRRSRRIQEVPGVVHQDDTQQKWADLGGYTCSAAVLKSEKFQNATPYNKAFYQSMFVVKDFWAVPKMPNCCSSSTSASIPT